MKNLVQVQQRCNVYFCMKIFFKSWLVSLIWPFECLILMILTMTKCHENSLEDSPLSLLSLVKSFSFLETNRVLKLPNETFLRITRCLLSYEYISSFYIFRANMSHLKGFFQEIWQLEPVIIVKPLYSFHIKMACDQ